MINYKLNTKVDINMYRGVYTVFLLTILRYGAVEGTNCTSSCADFPDFCFNNGTCYQDATTCQYGCSCTPSFSGQRCDLTTDVITTTTLRPVTERQCIPGFVCINGYCLKDGSSFHCSCDDGWGGVFCETIKCPIKCPNNADCVLVNDGFECKEKVATTLQPVSTTHSPTPNPTTLRPLSERQCIPGFVCINGYCLIDGSSFHCSCDDGWGGVFCETFKCPINCSKNANCVLVNDGFECKEKVATTLQPVSTTHSPTPNPTTLRPLSERQCIPGFVCINGYCLIDGSSFHCSCDDGWGGVFCETFKCPINCSKNADCVLVNDGFECKEKVATTLQPVSTTHSPTPNPTTLRPLSERQCIPGFVCINGYCLIDGSSFHCSCDDGWGGVFCETFKCPINCPNNADCVLVNDGFECKEKVATTLQPVSTTQSPTPNPTTTTLPTTTLRPLSERQCIPGFVCINGYCLKDGSSFHCSCDDGWEGYFCESLKCPINCPNNADCVLVNDGFECKEKVTTTLQPVSTTHSPTPNPTTTTLPTTTLRPLSERQCIPGFVCINGYCLIDGSSFHCSCDDGWGGVFCETFKCPIKCPNNADCVLVNDGFECKEKVTTTLQPVSTTQSPTPNPTTTTLPTTTLRPLSERQCVPGFVCIHGYCDKDGSVFSCSCDNGWEGYFCETFKCPIHCLNNADCVLVNGGFECKEKVTTTKQPVTTTMQPPSIFTTETSYSTSKTQSLPTTNNLPTTTLRPLIERECFPSFVCIHGVCHREGSAFYCSCDDGWEGAFCHRFICPLDCPFNTDCIMVGSTFECKAKSTTSEPPTTPSRGIPNTPLPTPVTTDNSTAVHACSANYTKRPLSERQCMPNFVCEYGACEITQGDIGSILECVCDDGGSGGLCQDLCCMPCSDYGQCQTLSNGTEYCQCQFNYEGDLCDEKKKPATNAPSSTEVDLWPLWVSAIVLVCLIVAAVLLFFWMWRNRVTIVMKIVHYFQAYEDDDEKTWDAFVSYKSADIDQSFVMNTLFPKLEKELGFTLCLHHRDFLPGETIANNIINAIDNSRRTILILTPRYVNSEFTRFEYQVAQHEMLKRKHKIIPILLEDIADVTDSMDPNLKQIIKSVTYLAYPEAEASEKKINHFWKKLILSMPKKRATEERQKQQKETVEEKEKKEVNNVDTYHDNVEGKLDKNGLVNPTFITDIVLTVEDERKIHENEKESIENFKEINIIEWTHL